MQKKWMSGMVIGMILLAGCGEASKPAAESKIQQAATISVSKEEYAQKIGTYQQVMTDEFQVLAQISTERNAPDFHQKNKEQIDKIKAVIVKYISLAPPTELQDIQKEYVEAMGYFEKGLNQYYEAHKEADQTKLSESQVTLTKGQDLWNHAFLALQATEEVPLGTDGTVTSKDLKAMDQSAGINRDSVLTNISKDGKELIGLWGVKSNDELKVQIELNADGSYKRYKEYPDESSLLKGRWKYDYLTQTLTLFNDEAFENGKSIMNETRREVKLEIQSFTPEGMQMMDTETRHTMKYSKK